MKRTILILFVFSCFGRSGSLEESITKLAATVDRLRAERAAYQAIAEGEGWTANVYKKNGVWWVRASNPNRQTVEEILYDDDRRRAVR